MLKRGGGSSKGVDFGGTIVVDFGYHHLELWANHEQDEMDGERRNFCIGAYLFFIEFDPYKFMADSSHT